MTIARVPEAHVARALGRFRPTRGRGALPVPAHEATALLKGWHADDHVRIHSAPKLLALPDQKASIFVGETVRFARTEAKTNVKGGLEFSVDGEAEGTVDLGERIDVTAHPNADGRRIALDVTGVWRQAGGDVTGGTVAGMTAETFERGVREHRLETVVEMPSGSWVLLGNPAWIEDHGQRVLQVLLLRAVVLREDAAGATAVEPSLR